MEVFKRKLIRYLTKNLLAAVTENEILTITNRGWLLGKRKLTEEEVAQLKDDAESFRHSVLWNLVASEIRYLANINMFEKGDTPNATTFGRAMLYNLQLIEKFMDRCKKL